MRPSRRSRLAPLCALLAAATMALVAACAIESASPSNPNAAAEFWPPRLGEPYPDLRLLDQTGRRVSLAQFKGRVILIEPVGMSCPACQAFAGSNREEIGPFAGGTAQRGLRSIEEYLAQQGGGVTLDDPRLVYVQLLLYDMTAAAAPTADDARRWAAHYGMNRGRDRIVLAGDPSLIGPASYAMVPGFQLVDRDFVLRVDSTGHSPRHDLWSELLPELARLVGASPVLEGSRTGLRMIDFELPDGKGRERGFHQLRDGRPAFVYFYSGCCGHCSEQLPRVAELAERFERRGSAIVGVEYLGNESSCSRNRVEFELPGTILADGRGEVCGKMRVGDLTVFTLDAAGVIRYRGPVQELDGPAG